MDEKTLPYNSDMIEGAAETPAPSPIPGFWRWIGICLLFVVPALLCVEDPLLIIVVTLYFGWIPFLVQVVAWAVVRATVRTHRWRNYLCVLVPGVAAFWLVFEHSFFYGRPRCVIGEALKEPAPLVFVPLEFSEVLFPDYMVRLRVRLDKDYLRNALEKHFERSQLLDGMPHQQGAHHHYHLKTGESEEGVSCSVETDDQFSYAVITYSTFVWSL